MINFLIAISDAVPLIKFNNSYAFTFSLLTEFIGFAVVFVISDDEVGVFYDVSVAIDNAKPSIACGALVGVNPIIARSSLVNIFGYTFAKFL